MIPGDKAYYPGTDVLVNRFDIRDPATARALEYKFAAARELELRASPIKGKFDFAHLQAIHRHLFLDMYDWAGKPRQVDFAKRDKSSGLVCRFVQTEHLEKKAAEFDHLVAQKKALKGLSKPQFIKTMAEVHTALNELHPFREGNGRAARLFLRQMAQEAGYKLDYTCIDAQRWHTACAQAQKQYDPKKPSEVRIGSQMEIRQIFHECATPMMSHVFLREQPAQAVKQYPALAQAYARLDALIEPSAHFDADVRERLLETEKGRLLQAIQAREQSGIVDQALAKKSYVSPGQRMQETLLSVEVDGRAFISDEVAKQILNFVDDAVPVFHGRYPSRLI